MLHRFEINVADVDRSVYADHNLRVSLHPSEDPDRMITRVLAFALEHKEGMEFGKGLSDGDEPALWARTMDGQVTDWIDVGAPSADRLHRAAKLAKDVKIYAYGNVEQMIERCRKKRIHRGDQIQVVRVPAEMLTFLSKRLARTNRWDLSVNEGQTTIVVGPDVCEAAFESEPLVG